MKKPVFKEIQAFYQSTFKFFLLKKHCLSRELVTYFKFMVTSLSKY